MSAAPATSPRTGLAIRSAASRKGWESRRKLATSRAAMDPLKPSDGDAPLYDGAYAPDGPQWGSAPLQREDMSIPAILARMKAREGGA